jgi:hypothetical protein
MSEGEKRPSGHRARRFQQKAKALTGTGEVQASSELPTQSCRGP